MWRNLILIAAIGAVIPRSQAQASLIDSFSAGDQAVGVTSGLVDIPAVSGPEIGGFRRGDLFNGGAGSASNFVAGPSYSGRLFWAMLAGSSGESAGFDVIWGGFGKVDLTDGGASSLLTLGDVSYTGSPAPTPLNVTFNMNDSSNFASTSVSIPGQTSGATISIPLSSFSGLDLTQISVISLDVSSTINSFDGSTTFSFSDISTTAAPTPEPSTFLLAVMGVFSIGWWQYKGSRTG
jgi:hypothetical protein